MPNETMVVTSSFVTDQGMPILYVSHEDDEEGGSLWQFHCGNNDYSMEKMQLVRLGTILKLDASINDTAKMKKGMCAKRAGSNAPWTFQQL